MPFDFAVTDWPDMLRRGETPLPKLPMNKARAEKAIAIFDSLQLPDVDGFPFLAEAAGEWFRDLMRAALASEDPETGLPLINEAFVLVPKKSSKTTNTAALGLTALILWERPNAELLILGPTQAIAERCFNQMVGMLKVNKKLAKIFHVQDHLKTITRIKTGAKLRVKTFDVNVVTGDIPALTIIDELHLLGAKNGAERVVKQITGGTITNHSALVIYITTQSDVPPQGVFKKKLDYARGVRDGRITGGKFLALIYEFPESMQVDKEEPWRDVTTWAMVLPNLGLSIHLDLLENSYAQAVEEGIESLKIWASQHLNIQIGMALHDDRWPGADHWVAAASTQPMALDDLLRRSEVCVIGVDWGGADDLASLAVIGRETGSKCWLHWSMSWARPSVLTRRKSIVSALSDFEKDGDLMMVATGEAQAEAAAEICVKVHETGLLPEEAGIGLDVAGVALLQDALEARGLMSPLVAPVPQGWRLQAAISVTALKLESGRMKHARQPIMAWAVGNAKQQLRGSNYMVTKELSGAGKIDPLMATFDAAELMLRNPVAAQGKEPRMRLG